MTMSSSTGSSGGHKKRSRWGSSAQAPKDVAAPQSKQHDSTVSEKDAANALLASALERQEQQEQQQARKKARPNSSRTANENETPAAPVAMVSKPNFGLSGALVKDVVGGNLYKGVVLKFSEPPEARAPNTPWRLYVFKGKELLETLHISRQSAYLLGKMEKIADIPLLHPSSSAQHAVLQYRALPHPDVPGKLHCQPYLMDLESTNGTFINDVRIDSARYYQLKKGDVLKFGGSTREYVLMTADTKSSKK